MNNIHDRLYSLNLKNIDFSKLASSQEVELVKQLQKYSDTIKKAAEEYEPSILARYLIEVATLFSRFYNECSVANEEDEKTKEARCILVYATSLVIKNGLKILGIDCPDKM